MAESSTFTETCHELDQSTSLSELEARGTVRLALKSAGLEARSVTTQQMNVILERVLPKELCLRGVADADALCRSIQNWLQGLTAASEPIETPDEVFARLGSSGAQPA
jgi:hypothetical protein